MIARPHRAQLLNSANPSAAPASGTTSLVAGAALTLGHRVLRAVHVVAARVDGPVGNARPAAALSTPAVAHADFDGESSMPARAA